MANKKEHGPHPFAMLREWKLAIKETLQAHAKTDLEYYKLAEFMDCLLLFSPTLDAGKVQFTASFAQIQELHNGVTRKSIYNRAERLKEMGILSWEQPEAKKKGEFNPTLWTVSKISAGKKDGGENSEGKKDGVPEGKKDRVPRVKDGGLQDFTREDFTRSGHNSGHTGHSSGQKLRASDTDKTDKTEDTDQNRYPIDDTCLECGATFDACVCEPYGGVNRWWIDDPQDPAALARYPNGQPELADLLQANPAILHDKGCPCYPRCPRILCTCGLYEILLENSDEPIPPNYGQIPYECIDGCGPRCTESCELESPEGDEPEKALMFGWED